MYVGVKWLSDGVGSLNVIPHGWGAAWWKDNKKFPFIYVSRCAVYRERKIARRGEGSVSDLWTRKFRYKIVGLVWCPSCRSRHSERAARFSTVCLVSVSPPPSLKRITKRRLLNFFFFFCERHPRAGEPGGLVYSTSDLQITFVVYPGSLEQTRKKKRVRSGRAKKCENAVLFSWKVGTNFRVALTEQRAPFSISNTSLSRTRQSHTPGVCAVHQILKEEVA